MLPFVHKKRDKLKKTTLGQEPVSVIYYTMNWDRNQYQAAHPEATLGYINLGVVYPESSYKIPLPFIRFLIVALLYYLLKLLLPENSQTMN